MGRNRSSRTSFVTVSVVRTSNSYLDSAFDVVVVVDNGNDDDDAFSSFDSLLLFLSFSFLLLVGLSYKMLPSKDVPHLKAFFGIRPAKDFGNFVRIRSSTIEDDDEEEEVFDFDLDFICSSSSSTGRDGRIPVQTMNSSRHAISV